MMMKLFIKIRYCVGAKAESFKDPDNELYYIEMIYKNNGKNNLIFWGYEPADEPDIPPYLSFAYETFVPKPVYNKKTLLHSLKKFLALYNKV